MQLDKDTQVCISVAARPSNFGTTVHNAGYRALELNFIYKAFAVTDIGGAMAGVSALGIRGHARRPLPPQCPLQRTPCR